MKEIFVRKIVRCATLKLEKDYNDAVITNVVLVQSEYGTLYWEIKECDDSKFIGIIVTDTLVQNSAYETLGYTLPFSVSEAFWYNVDGDAVLGSYEVNDFYVRRNGNEVVPIYKVYLKTEYFTQVAGTEVKIVNSSGNPLLENYIGRTFKVTKINEKRKDVFNFTNWSNKEDTIPESLEIHTYNVIPVKRIVAGRFVRFKTLQELIIQYGLDEALLLTNERENAIRRLEGRTHNLYVSKITFIDFTVTNLEYSYTFCNEVDGIKLLEVDEGIEYIPYYNSNCVKIGDNVMFKDFGNLFLATVLFTINGMSLIQFNPNCSSLGEEFQNFIFNEGLAQNIGLKNYEEKYCLSLGDEETYRMWTSNSCLRFISRDNIIHPLRFVEKETNISTEIKKLAMENRKDVNEGDRIIVRHKENMIKEFGETNLGEPKTWCRFTSPMEKLCGVSATIDHIYPTGRITLKDWECDDNVDTDFMFSLDMVTLPNSDNDNSESKYKNLIIREKYNELDYNAIPNGSFLINDKGETYRILKMHDRKGDMVLNVKNDGVRWKVNSKKELLNLGIKIIISFKSGNFNQNCTYVDGSNFDILINFLWVEENEYTADDIKALTNIEIDK